MANNNAEYKQDLNFFAVLRTYEKEQKKGEKKTGLAPILTLVAVGVLGIGYIITLFVQNAAVDAQLRSLKSYVEDADNVAVYKTRSSIRDELSALISYNDSCEEYIALLKEAPRLAKLNFDDVRSLIPENTQVLEFSYATPVLSVRCETSDKKAPAAYAQALTESGRFLDVSYTGFGATNNQGDEEMFIFTIECRLW